MISAFYFILFFNLKSILRFDEEIVGYQNSWLVANQTDRAKNIIPFSRAPDRRTL